MIESLEINLSEEEKILWSGQPEAKIHFTKSDVFLIPFSLVWCTIAVIWEVLALKIVFNAMIEGKQIDDVTLVLPIFGIPFVVIGLYFAVGRFLYKYKNKQNTCYVVTNKRVLSINRRRPNTFQEGYIAQIASINKSLRRNGIGTIRFGHTPIGALMYGNTGFDFIPQFKSKDAPTFYDIAEAEKVYKLVKGLKLGT